MLEVRKSLEILAIGGACERMTQEDIEKNAGSRKRFSELVESGEEGLTGLAEADVAFHDVIL